MISEVQSVRLFVAVFPDRAVIERLGAAATKLRETLSPRAIRWTAPEQLHLTLAFIGSVNCDKLAGFESALEGVAQRALGCVLHSAGVGCFPDARKPKVLWAGVTGEVSPLLELQKEVENSFAPLGYVAEERSFQPHLTLGRVNQLSGEDSQKFAEFLESFRSSQFGEWEMTRVDLMQSVLSSTGAKYIVVKSCLLGK